VTSEYGPAVRQAGPPAALRARVEQRSGRPAIAWTAPPTGLSAGRALFVDWSHAARGNAHADLAGLLTPLHLEGGPLSPVSPGPQRGPRDRIVCTPRAGR